MNDVADLVKQFEPGVTGLQFGEFVVHRTRSIRQKPVMPKTALGSHAASQGGSTPPVPTASPNRNRIK